MDAYTASWQAQTPFGNAPRALVVLLHGFGEHCRRYDELASALAGSGFTVAAMDLRGHGRSSGKRGDVGDLDAVLADVDSFFRGALDAAGVEGGFLLGHSMGGALAAAYAASAPAGDQDRAVLGLILSAPAVHVALRPALQVRLARCLSRVWPLAPVAKVDPRRISSQPEEQAAYGADPLVRPRTPVRAALTIHDAGKLAMAEGGRVCCGVLVVHGEEDTLVAPSASRALVDALPNADTNLVAFAGCGHEVHHDRGRDELARVITGWLASRC